MIPSELPRRARNLGQACAVLPVGQMSAIDVINIGLDNGAEKVGALMNLTAGTQSDSIEQEHESSSPASFSED